MWVILAASSKWHSIMRQMFISSTFQKSYDKTVYFREILLWLYYWVSTWMLPLKRGEFSEKNNFMRFWKEKCTNILMFVFRSRGRHISMVLFVETCNQTCFNILWHGDKGRLHFRLTLITKKIIGLRLMAWKTLEHNFGFCVGLGNNLITFMSPFCELSKGWQKPHPHPFYYVSRRVSCLWNAWYQRRIILSNWFTFKSEQSVKNFILFWEQHVFSNKIFYKRLIFIKF